MFFFLKFAQFSIVKNTMPKVSVIIPNYNYAKYLDERIQSVLAQTYRDFEVIILDDCSTDNSREIIERYRDCEQVTRIVYNDKNSGSVFRQWDKGISLAQGEYVWMAESDDVAEPAFLEQMMLAIGDDKSVAFAACDLTLINDKGIPYALWGISDALTTRKHDGRRFIKHQMLYECTVRNASSAVFRRDMALAIPLDYTQMGSAGDYLFWIELANLGKVIEVPQRLDRFRRHPGSVSFNADSTAREYSEQYMIYRRLVELKIPSLFSRYNLTGMRLWRMRLIRDNQPPAMKEALSQWRSAVSLPSLAEAIYICHAFLVRLPAKKFLYKKRVIRDLPSVTNQ